MGKYIYPFKDKKGITILMLFKKSYMILIANQTEYGQIKAANFTTDQRYHGQKKMLQKCIQDITKENQLLFKDFQNLEKQIYKQMTLI